MTYGTCIKEAREKQLLTQEQLAEQLDVSRQAVGKWETDLSRPTRDKLERLSELLLIPPEIWEEIDAEEEAARRPPDTAIPWKISTAVLIVLCVVMALIMSSIPHSQAAGADQLPAAGVNAPRAEPESPEALAADGSSPVLPETLPLFSRREYDFADYYLGEYDPGEVPFLDDWEQVVNSELWCGWFPDGTRLSLVPAPSPGTRYSNVFLLYAPPAETTGGELEYHILYRIGEDYTENDYGSPEAVPFANILGYEGFKITITHRSALYVDYTYTVQEYRDSAYIFQDAAGALRLMAIAGADTWEADVDEDGVLELVTCTSYPSQWEITDTVEGEEGATIYTLQDLDRNIPSGYTFACDPDRGGFTVTDRANTIISRCVLREGALACVPATDFSVRDYPDVMGTKITFVTDYNQVSVLTDEIGPDVILPYNPDVRITHRQQAYIALQELYNLTGLKVDSCYCAANEYGAVFSLLPDGFNERGFYLAGFGADYGCYGDPIPSFHIWWQELGSDWSPLSFSEAVRPEGADVNEKIVSYYNRLDAFNAGEVESSLCFEPEDGSEELGYTGSGEFYLTDGSLYEVYYLMRDGDPVLTALYGPYPEGRANH